MEAGSKRVDSPPIAHAAVRSVIGAVPDDLPLFAGGKSLGARMTSQVQALEPLPHVRGRVFFGFPLHPAGKPSIDRAHHLSDVLIPMLFLQSTRDALADIELTEKMATNLGDRATLIRSADADHSFHVLAPSGRTDRQVSDEMLHITARWMRDTMMPAL